MSVVVVGVDGSASSRDAVRWAARHAQLIGATLSAVATWRWPNYLSRVPPGIDPAADTAQTLDEVLADELAGFGDLAVTKSVVQGPAGPALVAQSDGAELLVVGSQGRAAFPGMLLGSVAEYCVRNGACPVVVVREAVPSGLPG